MKKAMLLFQPVMVCLLVACALQNENDWTDNIAGTYVTQYQQAYSNGWDTLIVQPVEGSDPKRFILERHTKYQRRINGKWMPAVIKITTRQVDINKTFLVHALSGRRYHYDPFKGKLSTGNTIYQKLK